MKTDETPMNILYRQSLLERLKKSMLLCREGNEDRFIDYIEWGLNLSHPDGVAHIEVFLEKIVACIKADYE